MHELQRDSLSLRFAQQVDRIGMVAKLAGRQGIERVDDIEDVVPLLFEHTMYKSYPLALLERQRFDRLTDWIAKLTAVELGQLPVDDCRTIDDWLDTLVDRTELDITYTSGTSGTMSFLPWSKRDYTVGWRINRINALQRFGEPLDESTVAAPYHYAIRHNRLRGSYRARAYTLGAAGHDHTGIPRLSADLMWLGARLRFAAARGDTSRVQVPAALLARRDELEQSRATEATLVRSWIDGIARLQDELVVWNTFPLDILDIAVERLARGERWSFAHGSALSISGGTKGRRELPPGWKETVAEFTDARLAQAYGMSELSTLQYLCDAGRYHLHPSVIAFALDPQTSGLLPRKGIQRGRFGFFDLLTESHWGGFLTGDEVELEFDGRCGCGATTQSIGFDVTRLSEKRGGDDKITCTATPEAYDEAMQFLTGL